MVATTTETLTVDGTNLKTLAKNIHSLAATLRSTGRRGANPVRGAGGTIWQWKPLDENSILLPMWVRGCDDDGLIPSGTARTHFFARIDELTRLFDKDYGQLDVRHTLPDSSVRQAWAEARDVIDFSTMGDPPLGFFVVELAIPTGTWQDTSDTTNSSTTIGSPWTWATGGTTSADELIYTVTGPITNPTISDSVSGCSMNIGGTVAGGQTMVVNAKTWAITGTGGFSPNLANLQLVSTVGRLMRLHPNASGQYRPQLSGSGTSGSTQLSIVGRKKYKVG